MELSVYLNTLRQKGYLAYEYNPFHNYQTDIDLYKVNEFIIPKGQAVNSKNGELLTKKLIENSWRWVDKRGNIIDENNVITSDNENSKLYAKQDSLIDLDTDKLNFDLEHPVDIQIQPSYDGSVNLILNDDKNIPRLINSRFSVREKNTYEIVDRIGENDTNIYNSKTFDKDTSLYFQYEYNPIVKYTGYVKGVLPVGQYCFYFTYCDADDNESDYIAESGLVPVFIGSDADPNSIDGGIKNQLSDKGIRLKLTNIDKSYNYLRIYYVRYFADYQQNRVYECKKINQRYPINSGTLYLQISGNESTEDLDPNILNISRFNPKSVLTSAQCKNMLFFGNIVKNADNYKELSDCALRIIPELIKKTIILPDNRYHCSDPKYGYYSSTNIYNNVGYFNEEYYRFGVVFIYQNGTLSNVYNTLGGTLNNDNKLNLTGDLFKKEDEITLLRQYIKVDDNGWIQDNTGYSVTGLNVNARGVCHFNLNQIEENEILGVKFKIPQEVLDFLKTDLGIRGLFFVRQKCIPNILAQCYLMPMDNQLEAPVIEIPDSTDSSKSKYYTECFLSSSKWTTLKVMGAEIKIDAGGREVTNDYDSRLYEYKHVEDSENAISNVAYAGICPDFLLNQPYYNQIFNGSKFRIKAITNDIRPTKSDRFYITPNNQVQTSGGASIQVTISSVTDDVPTVALNDQVYKLEKGETEEAFRFKYAEIDNGTYNAGDEDIEAINKATNLVRGKYSPFLAIYSESKLDTGKLYNIYQDASVNIQQEFQNRMDSSEPFYSISDRYNFDGLTEVIEENTTSIKRTLTCWRGDCYINNFTYRLNRNFNDPSLPNNDIIIDKNTWKDNYDASNSDNWTNISRSDLNAVRMGSWITFKVRSAINYALRSQDHSYVSEEALMGSPRSFFPRSRLLQRGANKMPDSYLFNDAYRATLGYKCYFALNDVNYIKNTFSNRIQYSAVAIQDSFKNNYRYSLSTYFRDYSQEYGSITKLVGFEGYLLVVFEHAIGIAVINERILAGQGDGEPVFINTKNVLPEELTIITDTYGTQWSESVVKSEAGYVYGVDTVAKKLWRVKGQEVEILSDFKVNKFLIDNITLGERETSPIIGLKNVKTHYNNNKKDIMFTFYDDIYKDEEKVWNLCYNELLGEFITFYSWVPSYSENIDTQFFTFDRNTSKELALLNKCNYSILENSGVLVDNPVLKTTGTNAYKCNLYYSGINKTCRVIYTLKNEDGTTSLKEVTIDGNISENGQYLLPNVKFEVEKDHWGNYKYVSINNNELTINPNVFNSRKTMLLYITPYLSTIDLPHGISGTFVQTNLPTEVIALTTNEIINNPLLTQEDKSKPSLTTDFYLHGQAGIFNVVEDLYPTHWYGEYHPFEFEFVVNDKIGQQKIFENLVIISNKAEPESFHFEVEGDNYEFSNDKRTMYFRQEATKELYQNLGSDILYDRKFTDVKADKYTYEQYYRSNKSEYTDQYKNFDRVYPIYQKALVQQVKSTIFPLYYERIDTYNDIYDKYTEMVGSGYDFKNLSGSEIKWNRDLNQFNIVTHIKNSPIDLVGRLRGNSRYKEGRWNVQIPSIIFNQKNEEPWENNIPPIIINTSNLPKDLTSDEISIDKIPNIYTRTKDNPNITDYIKLGNWTYRKEARIRDKWIKIRVRYSGKNLAVIHSLITLYDISYS